MKKYRLCNKVSYVIFDENVVVLDFNVGEFYMLDNSYIELFSNMGIRNEINTRYLNGKMFDDLIESKIIETF